MSSGLFMIWKKVIEDELKVSYIYSSTGMEYDLPDNWGLYIWHKEKETIEVLRRERDDRPRLHKVFDALTEFKMKKCGNGFP